MAIHYLKGVPYTFEAFKPYIASFHQLLFPMSHQPQYTPLAIEAFSQYLDSQIDLDTLIGRLRDMELQLMSDEEEEEDEVVTKSLWFRFFEGDPLQTTIPEIEKDLRNPDHPNCNILLRGIALGIESQELEVHYS